MKSNKAVNVITTIFAVIFSILLVIAAFGTVICSTVSSLIKSNSLTKMVQRIDYTEIIMDNEDVTEILKEIGVDAAAVDKIMQSDAVKDIVDIYATSFTDAIMGKEITEELTTEKIQQIVDENIDEITAIIEENLEVEVATEQLKDEIHTLLYDNAEAITEMLPSAKTVVSELDTGLQDALKLVFGPTFTVAFLVVSLILAGAVYALRFRRFGGFLWIGIDAAVAGMLAGAVAIIINLARFIIVDAIGLNAAVVDSFISVLLGSFITGTVVLLALAVVFIALFIILRKVTAKKAETVAEPAV